MVVDKEIQPATKRERESKKNKKKRLSPSRCAAARVESNSAKKANSASVATKGGGEKFGGANWGHAYR